MIQINEFKETNNVSLSNKLGRNNLFFVDPKTKQFVLPKINQCKLLRMAISCIDTKNPNKTVFIKKNSIWNYLGYRKKSTNSRYTFLAENISLLKTIQIVEDPLNFKKNKLISVFSETEWNSEDPCVRFEFDEKAMPYLICQTKFFYYSIKEIKHMIHKTTLHLFEFLISEKWKVNINDKCYVSVSMEELRKITFTTNQYERFDNWKMRVLVPSIQEINLYTSYMIEQHTLNKYGRNIKSIEFVLRKKASDEYQTMLIDRLDQSDLF